jgi:8-oxo-dGTP pyrophosphatase MutT (NUDIX family)
MPMGGAEAGETAEEAARRELSEETGLHAGHWTKLIELDLSTSLTDERCVVFLASDLSKGAAHPEPREVVKRMRAPFLEVLERVERGLIREAATVSAVLRAYRMAAAGALSPALSKLMLGEG